jgi:hypothetical protein
MANTYYLINAEDIENAKRYAPSEGLPNQLFQFSLSPDNIKAIVQADWVDNEVMETLGTNLGNLQLDGSAPQAVYNVITSWHAMLSE